MILPPAVVVHGLADADAALRHGLGVTLLSAPAAACFAGEAWWRALVARVRAAAPCLDVADILDCGAAPGRAMAALRLGQGTLVLDPACPAYPAVAACAATLGAHVMPARPPALDLSAPGARRRLAAWLAGG